MIIKPLIGIEYYGHLSRYIVPYELLNQLQFIDRRKKLLLQYIREKNKGVLNRYNEILHETSIKKTNNRKGKKQHQSDDEGNRFI